VFYCPGQSFPLASTCTLAYCRISTIKVLIFRVGRPPVFLNKFKEAIPIPVKGCSPCSPFCVEQGKGPIVDESEAVVGPVRSELDPGGETFRTEIEIFAFDAVDRNPGMCEDILKSIQ
jgi:hypothetical protein